MVQEVGESVKYKLMSKLLQVMKNLPAVPNKIIIGITKSVSSF